MVSAKGGKSAAAAAAGPAAIAADVTSAPTGGHCVGSSGFDPAQQVRDAETRQKTAEQLSRDDLQGALTTLFRLPAADKYVYHAMTSVQLAQVQHVVDMGGVNGLHDWYRGSSGQPLPPPPRADIDAYIAIFEPSTNTAFALKALQSNAKKGSIRLSVADHLSAKRFIHPGMAAQLTIPKRKASPSAVPPNPYFDFWAWSSRNLEWCGPCPESEAAPHSHHVLPVFMHHFGCAVPSYEAIEMLRAAAAGRPVADLGSGNGYWSFMLRQHGLSAAVVPVDSQQSEWRATWVPDTVRANAVRWLRRRENAGGRDMVLLVVYPVVGVGAGVEGGVEGGFTRGLMTAYEGDTVAVVGTQNRNGYTGFKNMTMDEYMAREQPAWTRVAQVPLPSFAGKDEALFIFQRGDRAPKSIGSTGS